MSRGPGQETVTLWNEIQSVLEGHAGPMNSRQVAYQLVGKQVIGNVEKEKRWVGRVIVKMRQLGAIPYSRIVDRTRAKHHVEGWESVEELLSVHAKYYRRNLWADQPIIPMIALEKRALEGVFASIVDEYGVSLWPFGGFNSLSFDYEWSEAIKEITDTGKQVAIAYFGDHDPSGLRIESKSLERLRDEFGAVFSWIRCGLLWSDFDEFNLARIPIKLGSKNKKGDPNAKRYRIKFGDYGAELDALPPDELERRIRAFINQYINEEQWQASKRVEASERHSLGIVINNWKAAVSGARRADQVADFDDQNEAPPGAANICTLSQWDSMSPEERAALIEGARQDPDDDQDEDLDDDQDEETAT